MCGAHNALSDAERATVLAIANSAEFADLPPSQIVPILAERGRYVASESTFYRYATSGPPTPAPPEHTARSAACPPAAAVR